MEHTESHPFDGKAFVRHLTTSPGVYRYFDAEDELLYVGKAANLKKRVSNYFLKPPMDPRIASMVSQIARAEVTLTRTAGEALLLESQLIKSLKPRYNIVFATIRAIRTFICRGVKTTRALVSIAARRRGRGVISGRIRAPSRYARALA